MNDPVSVSQRLYRTLLRAYPPSFHADYGDEMAHVFRDSCRQRFRQHGAVGVMGQWIETVPDLVVSVVDEHAQEGFQMVKTNLVRGLALAGIVGGALMVAGSVMLSMRAPGVPGGAYRESDDLLLLIMLGIGLVAAGTLGVYLQPARQWPTVTRVLLLLAIAGGLWAPAGWIITGNFFIMLAGFLAQILGVFLAGLTLLAKPATRSWSLLLIALAATTFMFNTEDWRAIFGAAAGILAIAIFALTLGEALRRQSEPPVAAA